ncbi:hypothetical protein [Aureimonas jatrophae]|jgi:hypothetical protein|uniref:Uncharacterized protein n=1 Tax=Aureimonas jatrophae TaxID=1166073 RepID=A0A1H0L7J7_9HYPH|nr:hypothetical protein [Aureimonas jatrophae]MBB3952442.1 hypothetical protein [Aureimonas jatrophae]SDO64188.1 hypothetical protein SAMN05192530_10975 [Aureimonas jatrophae]
MDSIKPGDGPGMALWKRLFGGTQIEGRLKLTLFLAAYLLIGGLTLAQWA